jgi:lipopolysaccharide transport system permease protein
MPGNTIEPAHRSSPIEPISTEVSAGAELRLQPTRGLSHLGLQELWEYRELLFFLTWRDIKVRYQQTVLGGTWAIIQPIMTMLAFSLFFGRLARVPSESVPYPLFCYVGLVPWTFFANGLAAAGNSLVSEGNLLRKVYFPRLAIPIAGLCAGLVDLALALIPLAGMMLYYGYAPSYRVFAAPLFILLAIVTSLGVGLWLSAANVSFRDVRYVLPFLAQFWMYITPIAYPSSLIKDPTLRMLYGLNPMTGVVEGLRWSLLGTRASFSVPLLAVSSLVSIVLLVTGAYYFRRLERTFADFV